MAIKRMAILIIVCFLLSFVRISYLTEEAFNYGKDWNSRSDYERWIYLDGFIDGSMNVYFKVVALMWEIKPGIMPSEFNKIMSKLLKFGKDLEPPKTSNLFFIISAMTELYEDPANAYIPIANMYFIAYRKLKGEDIEPLLQEARKEVFQNQ